MRLVDDVWVSSMPDSGMTMMPSRYVMVKGNSPR
jgi:hypothetical protein